MISAALVALVLLCLGGLVGALSFALPRPQRAIAVFLLVLGSWLLVTAGLARAGVFSQWDARPPRLPLVPALALLGAMLLQRTAVLRSLLVAIPRHWPVLFQVFRIGVELVFWRLYLAGAAPVQVTFEGRNFDILVGLTAPLVALGLARGKLSPTAVIGWNVAGLCILLNTVGTVLSSVPGPLHLNWPGEPFSYFASWPVIWIPAFLAPLAVFLHVFSIRQMLTLRAA